MTICRDKVVELGIVGNDVVGGLRRLASAVEAGEHPDVQFVVALAVDRDASFRVWAWGQCSPLETMGALARAVSRDLVDDG